MCSDCHRIVELQDCDLEDWISGHAARHGFTATKHQVEIIGLCADCRSAGDRTTSWPTTSTSCVCYRWAGSLSGCWGA